MFKIVLLSVQHSCLRTLRDPSGHLLTPGTVSPSAVSLAVPMNSYHTTSAQPSTGNSYRCCQKGWSALSALEWSHVKVSREPSNYQRKSCNSFRKFNDLNRIAAFACLYLNLWHSMTSEHAVDVPLLSQCSPAF